MIDYEHVRAELALQDTKDLVEILVDRDPDEWRPEVFPLVEEILRERGVSVAEAVEARLAERGDAGPEAAPHAGPVVLERFDSEDEAQLCQMALEQAGIHVQLEADDARVFELLVAESQADAARAVLEEAAARVASEDQAGDEYRCPHCGFSAEPIEEDGRRVCQVCGE